MFTIRHGNCGKKCFWNVYKYSILNTWLFFVAFFTLIFFFLLFFTRFFSESPRHPYNSVHKHFGVRFCLVLRRSNTRNPKPELSIRVQSSRAKTDNSPNVLNFRNFRRFSSRYDCANIRNESGVGAFVRSFIAQARATRIISFETTRDTRVYLFVGYSYIYLLPA